LNELLFLLFGWLLGLLSPGIVDSIKQKRINNEIKDAIIAEMNDLEYRLMLFSFRLFIHVGNVKQEFLKWALSVFDKYSGPFENKKMNEIVKHWSDFNDEQLAQRFRAKKRGLRISKIYVPFTLSKVNSLSYFPINFQKNILSILSQLTMLNEDIAFSLSDFEKTFIPEIPDTILENVLTNIGEGYERMGERARSITKIIQEIRYKNIANKSSHFAMGNRSQKP